MVSWEFEVSCLVLCRGVEKARKSAGITQQQLADKIGKKREDVAMLEKGETDMQLSTFIMISEALGLKFVLTY